VADFLLKPPRQRSADRGAIAGLDGIRAIAVIAVLLFHGGVKWLPGGLLGVDTFFVLSGFLITWLLLAESSRIGFISLRKFWGRRIRRLAPALILVVLAVSVTWGFLLKTATPSLRKDSLFALGYSSNWWFAFSRQGHFQSLAPPSPLLHTWSLAVEEQFYLLWPLAVVALTTRGRRVGRWALGGALLATCATYGQSVAGVWTDRLYYGTDTRAIPLLIGAACGAWFAAPGRAKPGARGLAILQIAGIAAAAGVCWAFWRVSGSAVGLYRGGFLLFALAVSVVILAVAFDPAGWLARVFRNPVLSYLGCISYGLYLWHWPIFLVVNHERTGLSGIGLLAARLGLSLTFAAASYRWIESPIRRGRIRLPRTHLRAPALAGFAAIIAAIVAVVLTVPSESTKADVSVAAQTRVPADAQVGSARSRAAGIGTTRVLFSGDSLALTLANALSISEQPYRLHLDNAGMLGCGVSRDPRRLAGLPAPPDQDCLNWPAIRTAQVRQERPDVVAFLVGRWELTDQFQDGRWRSLGDPDLDAYLSTELDRAIDDLSSTGAIVALLTVPCLSEPEQPDGEPYPEDDPSRITTFNRLLAQAQARHPQQSRLIDLNAIVCPGGRYTARLQGVQIRTTDGVHFPFAPIGPVAERLLPRLRALAVESRLRRGDSPVPVHG
jgi:peptidoglycan/LPS O-acetylase OafA/YrhL